MKRANFDLAFLFKNFCGAFADAAVLLPIIALLAIKCGASAPILLLTSGALYVFSGFYFKVPMAVQPLKSLAIAGAAVGVSIIELRTATFIFGSVLFLLYSLNISKILEKVPEHWIRCIQFGLGTLLLMQAAPAFGPLLVGLVALMIVGPRFTKNFPILGFIAVFAFIGGIIYAEPPPAQSLGDETLPLRWSLILSLILPQLVLTSANSVLGTTQVSNFYFKKDAEKVTTKNLLKTISIGNVLMSLIGGLPFCHGAGGVTAHVKGGATHAVSNYFIGFSLLGLGVYSLISANIVPSMNPLLMGALLASTGIFHMFLAKPLTKRRFGFTYFLITAAVVLATKNLLYVVFAVVAFDIFMTKVFKLGGATHDSL